MEALLQAQGYRFEPEPFSPLCRRLLHEPRPLGASLAALLPVNGLVQLLAAGAIYAVIYAALAYALLSLALGILTVFAGEAAAGLR